MLRPCRLRGCWRIDCKRRSTRQNEGVAEFCQPLLIPCNPVHGGSSAWAPEGKICHQRKVVQSTFAHPCGFFLWGHCMSSNFVSKGHFHFHLLPLFVNHLFYNSTTTVLLIQPVYSVDDNESFNRFCEPIRLCLCCAGFQ